MYFVVVQFYKYLQVSEAVRNTLTSTSVFGYIYTYVTNDVISFESAGKHQLCKLN